MEAARNLRSDLEALGWRVEEFDTRTWILRGADFGIMVSVQPEGAKSKINRIGFETNPGANLPTGLSIGNHIEVSFDGKQSGWIMFK